MVAAGSPSKELALLVLQRRGERLADLEPTAVSDAELAAVWHGLACLQNAGIAHGHLNLEVIRLDAGNPVFGDFRTASTAASVDRINSDTAELLLTTAGRFGVDRAVACAARRIGGGSDGRGAAIPPGTGHQR